MQTIQLAHPGGLDRLRFTETEQRAPGLGEVLVRIRASSINFYDYRVVTGMIRAEEGLIPMSDGAGEVVTIGDGVTEFAVGDKVVSTFCPLRRDGE